MDSATTAAPLDGLTPEQMARVEAANAVATVVLKLLAPLARTNPTSLLTVLTVVLANVTTWVPNATPETDKEMIDILVANVHATLARARLEVAPPVGSA